MCVNNHSESKLSTQIRASNYGDDNLICSTTVSKDRSHDVVTVENDLAAPEMMDYDTHGEVLLGDVSCYITHVTLF